MVNLDLLSHPINWLTIWLMVVIAFIALHLALVGLGVPQNSPESTS